MNPSAPGPGPTTPRFHAALPALLDGLTAGRNAWIEIDLDALETNLDRLRAAAGPGVDVIAVVKANAYGHGLEAARQLARAGAARLAVAWTDEGVALRQAGVQAPILVLGHSFPREAEAAVADDLALTCHSLALARALSAAACAAGRTAKVHVKVDTGLHRFGLPPAEAVALAQAIRLLPGLEVEGLSTHMANADEPDDAFSLEQAELFAEACRRLPWIPYRHVGNSATTIRRPELRYEAVRCGLALYGVAPPNTPAAGLRPVLSLRARVARVASVAPGEGVSYGLAWRAARHSLAALVPVGYADGWRRALARSGAVLIQGRRFPVIGRIAMDQFLVDVTDLPGLDEGERVTLIGADGGDAITATEVAAWEGTVAWETLAGLGTRLPRLYHRRGEVEAVE